MSSHFMSLSLLAMISSDPVRESLEKTSERWFLLLVICSAAVALGCVLEIGETWSDFRQWLEARKDAAASEEDKSWHKPIAALGLLLVILGVIGEGVFEALSSNAETKLRAHDEQVLADTIVQAGTAKDSAEKAQKAAELAKQASDAAMGKATEASGKAESVFGIATKANGLARGAFGLAGEANTKVDKVDAKIQTTEENVERVDEKFSFRTLSPAKRFLFIEALKKARNKSKDPIQFQAFMSVADGTTYGSEIANAMNDPSTGWRAGEVVSASLGGGCKGVVLSIGLGGTFPDWAGDLQQALQTSGIGGGAVPNERPACGYCDDSDLP